MEAVTRDELRYVLDPKDVMGEDYPSETFRVLQKNEIARHGEYRTRRLVLAAYDELSAQGMRPRVEGYCSNEDQLLHLTKRRHRGCR
ncbi:hypothetical protein [Erythrobacter sp.]|uniref:hypothetical protein n=1 Tax=Erythrobacter sp. TaxID=1042 RepID=UPI0025DEB22B|nr:hypothetical protein [Erythrobacter sp.]